jgi:hypothetical protein
MLSMSIEISNQPSFSLFFIATCSNTHRDLVAELPFVLMHPKPEDTDDNILITEQNSPNNNGVGRNSVGDKQHAVNNNSPTVKDDVPNLIQLDG